MSDPPPPLPKSLALDFCGMHWPSPTVLLSGCVGFAQEYTRVHGFNHRDIGAVCLKGVTVKPTSGNAPKRMVETAGGMLNAIGLQNPGIDKFIEHKLTQLNCDETCFIANICGCSIAEYQTLAQRLEQTPLAALELNISCPNVKERLIIGNDPEMSARVVAACRKVSSKPLITKLSPNQTDIADNARRCLEAGSDAFAVINTVTGMHIDIETQTATLGYNQGGLSGPAIKPIALLKVHEVYQVCKEHQVPIIGQGGICSAEDAIEFIIAGATAVGLGTGLFYDPLLYQSVNRGIASYLQDHHFSSVTELSGCLKLHAQAVNNND